MVFGDFLCLVFNLCRNFKDFITSNLATKFPKSICTEHPLNSHWTTLPTNLKLAVTHRAAWGGRVERAVRCGGHFHYASPREKKESQLDPLLSIIHLSIAVVFRRQKAPPHSLHICSLQMTLAPPLSPCFQYFRLLGE